MHDLVITGYTQGRGASSQQIWMAATYTQGPERTFTSAPLGGTCAGRHERGWADGVAVARHGMSLAACASAKPRLTY